MQVQVFQMHISDTRTLRWYLMKAPISHVTASRPDYKVQAVHFSEHDDMLSKDDKCPHKQVRLENMLAIFLCGFATANILTKFPIQYVGEWKAKGFNSQESSTAKRQKSEDLGTGVDITSNITTIQSWNLLQKFLTTTHRSCTRIPPQKVKYLECSIW